MAGKVVIIIPSQGQDTAAFESVALKLKQEVYSGATIVKTTVTDSGGSLSVTFATRDGHSFSWDATLDLSRVLTISHAFSGDGPNLAYHAGGYQPWGSDGEALSAAGQSFWQSVGRALRSDGKIILLGCFMGGGAYAGNVAKATGKKVYAATDLFGAGDAETAVKYVRAIESGLTPAPMKQFKP